MGTSPKLRSRLTVAVAALGCALSLALAPAHAVAQDSNGAAAEPTNYAEVLRQQRSLLLKQARAMEPQRPGVADLYFIAFGGEARQDVFLKEVRYAKKLFDRRFDTEKRSIVMVNNQKTINELPLASLDNLRLALNFVSHTIDREEDVVFLFITTHGSQDHQLSLDMPPFELENLNVSSFRNLLDKSKIKWRIIVVSACYSGGFVDPLKDDYTLIMTASRRDRTSFGCSNTASFTYFGRAYFAEALTLQYSFVDAFVMAKDSISQLERQQRLQPSLPQIFVGPEIQPKLFEIEQRLSSPNRVTSN